MRWDRCCCVAVDAFMAAELASRERVFPAGSYVTERILQRSVDDRLIPIGRTNDVRLSQTCHGRLERAFCINTMLRAMARSRRS